MGIQRWTPSAVMPSTRLASVATRASTRIGTAMSAVPCADTARPKQSAMAKTRTAVVIRHVRRAARVAPRTRSGR